MVFGAAAILIASYAPIILDDTVSAVRETVETEEQGIQFRFADVLENSEVITDPDAYPAEFADENGVDPSGRKFLLQAASLRASDDADALRATLTLMNLPARSDRVVLDSGTWYRVTVGPFDSRLDAERAMTRLREQNLSALLLKVR